MEAFFDDLKDMLVSNGRLNELEQIADINRFIFTSKEKFSDQDYLIKKFYIFRGKKDKRFKGILRKKDRELNASARIYDYIRWGEIKTQKTSIFEINCPDLVVPKFQISPKGVLNQVGNFFKGKERAFPEQEDFHNAYNLETSSTEDLESALTPKFFAQLSSLPNITIEAEGDYLLIYFLGKQIPATEIMDTYEDVRQILDIILNDDSNDFV